MTDDKNTAAPTESEIQRISDDFVRREVELNVSMLIESAGRAEGGHDVLGCDEDELMEAHSVYVPGDEDAPEDSEEAEDEYREVFEFWVVSRWLASALESDGEKIIECSFGHVWGRTCSGQAISMDENIRTYAMNRFA